LCKFFSPFRWPCRTFFQKEEESSREERQLSLASFLLFSLFVLRGPCSSFLTSLAREMAAPTLKQLWKRAPTAPSAQGGEGQVPPPLAVDADAAVMMATKEPSQLIVEGDSGNPQKPPAVDAAAAAAATADASVTVMVVDDDAVRERKEEREREEQREIALFFEKKRFPTIDSFQATHPSHSTSTLPLPFSRPKPRRHLLLLAAGRARVQQQRRRRRAPPQKTRRRAASPPPPKKKRQSRLSMATVLSRWRKRAPLLLPLLLLLLSTTTAL
jgi:hypothetical protein